MTGSVITTFAAQASLLLAGQFKGKPNLEKLLGVFVAELQELEFVFQQLKYLRTIDRADGVQLDALGVDLNQKRGSLTDAQYRSALKAAVVRNTNKGTPDDIIRYVMALTNATDVDYAEVGITRYTIEHNGTQLLGLAVLLRDVTPCGCGPVVTNQSSEGTIEA